MKRLILLAAVGLSILSCSKEDACIEKNMLNSDGNKQVFHATTDGVPDSGTKVYADEDLKVLWNADDRISVFAWTTAHRQYLFMGDDGDTGGDFEDVTDNKQRAGEILDYAYAVYPYHTDNFIRYDARITVNLPAEQSYKEHSFGIGANTMVAVTDDYYLPFKNVCGYLKFRFYGDDVQIKSITLEGNNGEKIAGTAYITASLEDTPSLTMDEAATTSITINCEEPVTLGTSSTDFTEFIFVIPPTTFSNGFKVLIIDSQGRFFEKTSTKSLTISRNKMESMGTMKVSPGYVKFEDDIFNAYCVENFDKDGDGEINYLEAQKITSIDISTNDPDITSLKGVEYFKNLKFLKCRKSSASSEIGKLAYLDVSGCASLKTLWCDSNQLASLNIRGCTALETLYCNSNQLTGDLDVSGFSHLRDLRCNSNQLTSLDVSGCTALKLLYCYDNQLTGDLYVRGFSNLRDLRCQNNQLTSLDVSGCTALSLLYCYSNQLTSLDVSGCTALTELRCQDNQLTNLDVCECTALTLLYCNSNQLTSLNVSGCSVLETLLCYDNQLTGLDVSECSSLTELRCGSNQLTSLDVSFNTNLAYLSAWPQSGTLSTLIIKRGQNISYYNANPSDYGTEIIEVD